MGETLWDLKKKSTFKIMVKQCRDGTSGGGEHVIIVAV